MQLREVPHWNVSVLPFSTCWISLAKRLNFPRDDHVSRHYALTRIDIVIDEKCYMTASRVRLAILYCLLLLLPRGVLVVNIVTEVLLQRFQELTIKVR